MPRKTTVTCMKFKVLIFCVVLVFADVSLFHPYGPFVQSVEESHSSQPENETADDDDVVLLHKANLFCPAASYFRLSLHCFYKNPFLPALSRPPQFPV